MSDLIEKVMAQGPTPEGICNPLIKGLCGAGNAGPKFSSLVAGLLALFLIVASLFTFLNLLLGGLSWITSGGDKAALDAARSRIQNALLGVLIVFASWVVFIILMQFLGLSPINSTNFEIKFPSLFGQ